MTARFSVRRFLSCSSATAFAFASLTMSRALLAQDGSQQTATMSGIVRMAVTGTPLPNAEVSFPKLKLGARTNSAGKFSIVGIPAGKQNMVARLIGYEPYSADIKLAAGQLAESNLILKPTANTLQKVDVKAAALNPRLAEFEERRASPGSGRFFTADIFDKARGRKLSDVFLGRVPGMRRLEKNGIVALTGRPTGMYNCFVQLVVNDIRVTHGSTDAYNIDQLQTPDIIGAEYYGESQTPLKYQGPGAECGTLVLWTK